ncbi:MAG: hypothetical protein SGJ27_28065, partial [Candidatus Melainabacteria bacterium]|nr:hypothetical protein [Candidatus Melainabacteria bacterium]
LSSLAYLLSLSLLKEYATLFNYSKHNIWQKLIATTYDGINKLADGKTDEAIKQFQWVKDHGVSTRTEYQISLSFLKRLSAK